MYFKQKIAWAFDEILLESKMDNMVQTVVSRSNYKLLIEIDQIFLDVQYGLIHFVSMVVLMLVFSCTLLNFYTLCKRQKTTQYGSTRVALYSNFLDAWNRNKTRAFDGNL